MCRIIQWLVCKGIYYLLCVQGLWFATSYPSKVRQLQFLQ